MGAEEAGGWGIGQREARIEAGGDVGPAVLRGEESGDGVERGSAVGGGEVGGCDVFVPEGEAGGEVGACGLGAGAQAEDGGGALGGAALGCGESGLEVAEEAGLQETFGDGEEAVGGGVEAHDSAGDLADGGGVARVLGEGELAFEVGELGADLCAPAQKCGSGDEAEGEQGEGAEAESARGRRERGGRGGGGVHREERLRPRRRMRQLESVPEVREDCVKRGCGFGENGSRRYGERVVARINGQACEGRQSRCRRAGSGADGRAGKKLLSRAAPRSTRKRKSERGVPFSRAEEPSADGLPPMGVSLEVSCG